MDISNFTAAKTFMLTNIFDGLDNLEELKAPLSFIEISKIYKNEIKVDNLIFSNEVKIIEVDPKTNKEKTLFECDFKNFAETQSELYGKFAL